MFNYEILKKQIKKAYMRVRPEEWSLEEVIDFFMMYYRKYEEATGREHPYLTTKTIEKIIGKLSYIHIHDKYRHCREMDDLGGYDSSICKDCGEREYCGYMVDGLALEDYEDMIDEYFKQRFPNCDYSIVHFMSGDVRMFRFYEAYC